jgi:hypothetical protein
MGAIGTRAIIDDLMRRGFHPIELERYCTSNKIWQTKVKRLRLPDLMCPFTGARFEARAKSNLAIRMSDAPDNPDRTWDAGLRDADVIALTAVAEEDGVFTAARSVQYFTVGALRQSVRTSQLGPPKGASEGAERDRTWPSTVASRPGVVLEVSDERIVVEFAADDRPTRRQSYRLNGKIPYVRTGQPFEAGCEIIAGTPARKADLSPLLQARYDPAADLSANSVIDRYAAIKALRYRRDTNERTIEVLERKIREEEDARVALEAASSAAAFGSRAAEEHLSRTVRESDRMDLRMESIFILTELANAFGRAELIAIANDRELSGTELRQAAAWGLGRMGIGAYDALVDLVADEDENVGLHAIAGLGPLAPADVVDDLIHLITEGTAREAAAASEALRYVGTDEAVARLLEPACAGSPWALATLARMPAEKLRANVRDEGLKGALGPLLLFSEDNNWLMTDERRADLAGLQKQLL